MRNTLYDISSISSPLQAWYIYCYESSVKAACQSPKRQQIISFVIYLFISTGLQWYFQNWKWSLWGEDFRRWRKIKQSHRQSWTRYEKMTSRNDSKTGSAARIVVKLQKGTTLKVMPAPNV